MELNPQIAKHFNEVFFGGNWTSVNFKDVVEKINWQQAVTKLQDLNTIAALTFHINYYVEMVLKVLRGGPLEGSDKYSFDIPPIHSEAEWQSLVNQTLKNADAFAHEISEIEPNGMFNEFTDPKYGNNYRNIVGIIEHTHYHLGQIVIISKLLNSNP